MLQVELQTLHEFLEEMEKSHSELIEAKNAFEIKAHKLEIENAALREENNHSKCITEV